MSRLREFLDRPFRDQPRAVLALGALVVIGIILALSLPRGGSKPNTSASPQQPAAPVITGSGTRTTAAVPATPTTAELASARRTAQRFLASYLPALYGRKPLRDVPAISAHVRRALVRTRPAPAAIRRRHPRLVGLEAQPQAARSVLMTATVDDGVVTPFHLIFTIERQPDGRWLVTDLAND